MKNYIILLLLSFTTFVQAQQINGTILFDDDYYNAEFLDQIKITNQRTNEITLSKVDGTFSINAISGDKIILTSAYIIKRIITISEKSFAPDFKIYVEPNLIQLGEARFGYLNKNLEKNKFKDQEEINTLYKNMGLNPELRFIEPKKDVSKFKPSDLKNPLRLYEHLSGKNKDLRQLRIYESIAQSLQQVEDLFDIQYYTVELNIPEYKIKEFIRWVNSKQNLSVMLQQSTTEMIKDVLYQHSFEYRKLLQQAKS